MNSNNTCNNCTEELTGKYCKECGQAASTHDISLHFLWHDIQHSLFHFEKGFLYTLKELFTRPGNSIREFIQGKRVKHFRPFAFIFLLAGIYSFLNHYFHISEIVLESMPKQKTQLMNNKVSHFVNWVSDHYAISILMYLPFTSFASYLAFKKYNYNYLQHFVANSYISGFHIFIGIICMPLLILYTKTKIFFLTFLSAILCFVFSFITLYQFFNFVPKGNRILRIFFVALNYLWMYLVLIIIITVSMLMTYGINAFKPH